MPFHAIPCNIMQYHAIPCHTMQYHAIPCNTMHYHAIPCNTMQYHAILCNTMQYHAIPCISNNCWRSVPLPCGQYKAIFIFLCQSKFNKSQPRKEIMVTIICRLDCTAVWRGALSWCRRRNLAQGRNKLFRATADIRCREGESHFPIPMCSFGILDLSICFVLMVMIHCQDKRANR